jgi:hypothetical protein
MSGLPVFVKVPAARGWDWLVQSHGMFAKARMYWLLLIIGYYMITVMMTLVPVIGLVAATLLKPVFAVGFLAAAWAQERGEPPKLHRLFAGFRSNLRALLPLGVVYGAGIALALVLSAAADGGVLMRWFLLGEQPSGTNPMQAPGIQSAILMALFCAVPTFLALWFAPALIVFQDQPTVTALVQSFRAAIANLAAIIVYAMSVFLFWVVIPGMIISVSVVLFGKAGVTIGVALSLPFTLSVIAIIFIADYVVYRDLFHHHEGLGAANPRA